jgi:DNA-binding response OmpR family regulator
MLRIGIRLAFTLAPMTNGHRVLVIDDEAVLRGLLRDMLAACGYEVDLAEDGAAGVARFQQSHYRAVITDLLMPGMNGFEVARALRTIDPAVRIIMLTGSAPQLTAGRAREAGLTLLHKPIALSDLKAAVDAACRA